MSSRENKRGFTLIELLVVIAIIGLLSSIVFASLNTARLKARDTRRMSDLHQIQLALNLYYSDKGHYPVAGPWFLSCEGSGAGAWANLQTELAPYITLPKDPINTGSPACGGSGPWNADRYTYAYGSNGGEKYDLIAGLEQSGSPYSCGVKKYKYHDWGTESDWCGPYWVQLYADH